MDEGHDDPAELTREGARLLGEGKAPDAVIVLTRAAELRPDHAPTFNALGVALRSVGQVTEAVAAFGTAVAIDPGNAPAYANLAKTLYASSKFVDALAAAEEAVALRPEDSATMGILGGALLGVGRPGKAKPILERAVELSGGRAAIRCLLARALDAQGDFIGAAEQSRKAIESEPDNPECVLLAARFEARLREIQELDAQMRQVQETRPGDASADYLHRAFTRQGGIDKAPEEYVTDLFDEYATRFDKHLVEGLRYTAHKSVGEACVRLMAGRVVDAALDAGCGTGLAGEYLRPLCRRLDGVDLSGKMLDIADKLDLYDGLYRDDIDRHLNRNPTMYGLVAAADVYNYFGNLRPAFEAVRLRCEPGAPFVFTVEWQDQEGWRLSEQGRFVHSPEAVAEAASGLFKVRELSNLVLRAERGDPVFGLLCVLEALP